MAKFEIFEESTTDRISFLRKTDYFFVILMSMLRSLSQCFFKKQFVTLDDEITTLSFTVNC